MEGAHSFLGLTQGCCRSLTLVLGVFELGRGSLPWYREQAHRQIQRALFCRPQYSIYKSAQAHQTSVELCCRSRHVAFFGRACHEFEHRCLAPNPLLLSPRFVLPRKKRQLILADLRSKVAQKPFLASKYAHQFLAGQLLWYPH